MGKTHKNRIGLALGGGSARGWAHIGVIHTLNRAGIYPDIVCVLAVGFIIGAKPLLAPRLFWESLKAGRPRSEEREEGKAKGER